MGEKELVKADGWLSDESAFYGDQDEQERLSASSRTFGIEAFEKHRQSDLNALRFQMQAMPPPDLHNVYEGMPYAWQLNEAIDDFVQRLPPLTTPVSTCRWIWAANPYPAGRDLPESGRIDELRLRGEELLEQSLHEREKIQKANSTKPKAVVTKLLHREAESLKQCIADLAEQTGVLSGKWMLFPSRDDLTRVWRMVVEGTINDRLGSAAKVATDEGKPGDRLICVYTKSFRDTEDVLCVLNKLVAMGLVPERGIYYKSDAYTYLDIYGDNASEYGLQASAYSSQKLLASAKFPQSKAQPQKKQSTLGAAFHRSRP